MRATVPTDLLLRLLHATPAQWTAVERILYRGSESAPLVVAAERPRHFLFRKAGSHWDVTLGRGELFHLKDSLGAEYLDYLLHHPNEVISAYDLEVAVKPEKAWARSKDTIQKKSDPEEVKSHLRELDELRAKRVEALETGQEAEVVSLTAEIEILEVALSGSGVTADTGERARQNVGKAIAGVRRQLAKGGTAEKEFARHIGQFVSTGYQCIYNQAEGRVWD